MPQGLSSASRFGLSLSLVLAIAPLVPGCASQQAPDASATASPATIASQPSAAGDAPSSDESSLRPLPFKGRLLSGNPDQLPPIVAMSLSNNSLVTFSYREELTHEEHHTPMLLSALDPRTYIGQPTGEYGVTAFASLSVSNGSQIIGDYTARVHITRPYGNYSQPTHRELDDAARTAVREEIDRKLEAESARLTASVGETE